MIALGCWSCKICALIALNDNKTRSHLIPPAVEPAQAHCIENRIIIIIAKPGQTEESAVANPVVDATETIWNNP